MRYFVEKECSDAGAMTLADCKVIFEDDDIKEVELLEVKRDIGGPMYCSEKDFFVEKWVCGRSCKQYNPCNKISGRCRYLENGFKGTGKEFLLTKSGLEEVKE